MVSHINLNFQFKKKHSLRVYKHALDIYENRHWFKAQDHLNFVMSRLNYNLKNLSDALMHINSIQLKRKLPQRTTTYAAQENRPNPSSFTKLVEFSNETNILKDFILYSNNSSMGLSAKELPTLMVPLIDCSDIKINLLPFDSYTPSRGGTLCLNDTFSDYLYEPLSFVEKEILSSLNNATQIPTVTNRQRTELKDMWLKYEHSLYYSAYRTAMPIMFKPYTCLFDNQSDNKQMPKVVVDETVAVMFELRNNLKINLLLNDATLLWKFVDTNGEVTNEVVSGEDTFGDIVECSTLNELNLAPFETYKIRFSLIPKRCGGQLSIMGLKYRLSPSIETSSNNLTLSGKQLFEIRGPRLNNNKSAMSSVVYDVDNRLNLKIMNKSAQLQVKYFRFNSIIIKV